MESKGIRLNHVVFKARFAQGKIKTRDFKAFTDTDQVTRNIFKSVMDPATSITFVATTTLA